MLIKDCINTAKLETQTANININISFSFTLNDHTAEISIDYLPFKDRLVQQSVFNYVNKLNNEEHLAFEDFASRVTEDLFDMAIPKKLNICFTQTIHELKTTIHTQKSQPKIKD